MAEFDTHETDLYILTPPCKVEAEVIVNFLHRIGWPSWGWTLSDTEGQRWFGKWFIDIPFGKELRPRIVKALKENS